MRIRDRRRRQAGLERRVAGDLLEEEADEEEAADQPRVGGERGQVGDPEVADPEEAERRIIGCRARASRTTKSAKQTTPTTIGSQTIGSPQPWAGCSIRAKIGPPSPIAESAIPSQSIPRKASSSRLSSHRVQGEADRGRDQRDVDPEDRPPGADPDQGAAAGRSEHRGDPGPGGPGPDRLAARRAVEGGGDDRQRAGHEQRPGDPLQDAGADQELGAGSDRAERRGRAEGDQPDHEHPAAAELVAEAAADQEQGDERQRVRLDHPLLAGEADVEAVADRRQGDVDDGAVEEDDRRAEDRRDQRQTLLAGHGSESTFSPRPPGARSFPPGRAAQGRERWRLEQSG